MATITSPRASSPASITPRIKSPPIAETPTSSTRGSFDLTARSSASASGPAVPRRGNRAALRDYYNLKSRPEQQPSRTASITSTTSDISTALSAVTLTDNVSTTSALTAQLDGEAFDAQAYVNDLLATSSLKEILKVEAMLISEIRNLDGERKALVYDNYSKLIKAVGTIGEMQRSMNETPGGGLSEVGELEGKMEGLREMVRMITSRRDERVAGGTEERRTSRRATKEQERKREVVSWVLAAAGRLRELVEQEHYDEAEREWETVRSYLDKWHGVRGVAEVRKACEDVMAISKKQERGQEE